MKTYEGVDVEIHIFFTSALVGGEWSASRPGRFTPEERIPPYPLDRVGGPQSRSGRYREEKNLALAGNRNQAAQPVTRRYTD
jgi:hypothetical protein